MSYKQRFEDATDYLAFAGSILAAAHARNADAEYYLWAALRRCKHDPTAHFDTLAQAEQMGAVLSIPMETVHKGYERCHRLLASDVSDLGDAWEWLNRAAKDGQPVAAAAAVGLRMTQDTFKAAYGRLPDGFPEAPIGGDAAADPHPLVLQALKSRDPDALLEIGEIAHHLAVQPQSHRVSLINTWAWRLMACQRGADCSTCGKYCDPVDMMETAGNDWSTVQQRAQALGEELDAGQWSQLGLGLSDD